MLAVAVGFVEFTVAVVVVVVVVGVVVVRGVVARVWRRKGR